MYTSTSAARNRMWWTILHVSSSGSSSSSGIMRIEWGRMVRGQRESFSIVWLPHTIETARVSECLFVCLCVPDLNYLQCSKCSINTVIYITVDVVNCHSCKLGSILNCTVHTKLIPILSPPFSIQTPQFSMHTHIHTLYIVCIYLLSMHELPLEFSVWLCTLLSVVGCDVWGGVVMWAEVWL